jgi:hypothetical protein
MKKLTCEQLPKSRSIEKEQHQMNEEFNLMIEILNQEDELAEV